MEELRLLCNSDQKAKTSSGSVLREPRFTQTQFQGIKQLQQRIGVVLLQPFSE
jgi:hypothetical protein